MADVIPHGEQNLDTLLATMRPHLSAETFVYASVSAAAEADTLAALGKEDVVPVMKLREPHFPAGGADAAERTTALILPHPLPTSLQQGPTALATEYKCKRVTLAVESSLAAVGLLAAVCAELAKAGISVNAVAGYWHDHLFVEEGRAEEAGSVVKALAERARRG